MEAYDCDDQPVRYSAQRAPTGVTSLAVVRGRSVPSTSGGSISTGRAGGAAVERASPRWWSKRVGSSSRICRGSR